MVIVRVIDRSLMCMSDLLEFEKFFPRTNKSGGLRKAGLGLPGPYRA